MKTFAMLITLASASVAHAQDAGPDDVAPQVDDATPAVPIGADLGSTAPTSVPTDAPSTKLPEDETLGENIPRAHDEARYQSVWANNPFTLKTVSVVQNTVTFAQDWALAGMYRSPTGKVTVTLQNKQTSEYKRISSEDTDGEFRLIEPKFNRNRNEASAVIGHGNQTAELKYDDSLTSKPVTINNTLRGSEPVPGQPGLPGQPGSPVSITGGAGAMPRPGAVPPGASRTAIPGAMPTAGAPGNTTAVTPPSISRRRQLIPPPTSPAPAPQP